MNQDRSIYDNLADQFDQRWQAGQRPALQDYLDQVDMADRQTLAEMLLSIEIEYRLSAGEPVSAVDYQNQAEMVRQVAEKLLSKDQTPPNPAELSSQQDIGETRTLPPGNNEKSRIIGRYKLLQQLGEGGMGTVWMAEQQHPVRRRVALKLIKGGADNREIIARFEAERQALAMMDHPNIAKVLDAGTTEDGLPYFVMELVQGIAINEYCDRNKLSPKQRMELFVPACKAVQHAHQKGIIHRDLKPSNVLVALYDGKPIAKVIDFGLAKAIQHHTWLTDKTMFTQFGQVVGTPQYMSPEQATMDQISVDTRSDVYSLGVMLYELLAGSTPIDREMMKDHALLKVLELIREQEPPRPSLRVSTAGDRIQTIGEHRQIQPLKLQQILRGDLDWIVMKAIEKDCSRRYETASGFADDIERYLRGDAIEARPPSTAYRVSKFLSKHRRLAAMAAAVFLLLTAGVVGTSVGLFRAQAAREVADRKTEIAIQKSEIAKEQTEIAERQTKLAERQTEIAKQKTEIAKRKTEIAKQKTEELAVEKERADLEKARAQQSAKEARDAESAAIEAQKQTESTLARSNFLLANARWEQQRVGEARQTLNRVPLKHRNFEWYLSRQQFLGSSMTSYHHTDEVISVAFSADGTRLITSSKDQTIKIIDLSSGDLLRTIKHRAIKITLSPDGKLLATANFDRSLSILDVETGNVLKTFEKKEAGYYLLAFSPDSSQIATAGSDNDILIQECLTGEKVKTFPGHENRIISLAFSPDGSRLVSCSYGTIKFWDAQTGAELKKLEERTLTRSGSLVFSPDGTKLANRAHARITIRDSETGNVLRTIQTGQNVGENEVAFSPDGTLVAGNFGPKIVIWDVATGSERQTLIGHLGEIVGVQCLAFSPDGTKLVSGGADNTVKIWAITEDSGNTLLSGYRNTPPVFSPDGACFVCGHNTEIKMYDSTNGKELKALASDSQIVARPAFSPNGAQVAFACQDNGIRIWDLEKSCELAILAGHTGKILDLAFSPDGTKLASCSDDNTTKLWNALDGTELSSFAGHSRRLSSVLFSPDGTRLATSSWDGTVKIRDVDSGKELTTLEAIDRLSFTCAAFSPDGSQLVAGGGRGASGVIQTWDVKSGTRLHNTIGHGKMVTSVSFSPDGTRLASGSLDKTVRLWDTATGSELKTISGHQFEIGSVAFSPDNCRLISSDRRSIKVWDAGKGFKTISHSSKILKVGISQDAERVVAHAMGGMVAWDAATGKQLPDPGGQREDLERQISADKKWQVAKSGTDVLLLDLENQNSPQAKSYRELQLSLKLHQIARLAEEAEAREDWFGAVFHRAWEMKADPYQSDYRLKSAMEKLKASSQPESESPMPLPPIVTEMLERPRPAERPITGQDAIILGRNIWKQVKSPLGDTKDPLRELSLQMIRKWDNVDTHGHTLAILSAAQYRSENYESAIADAMQSLQRSGLRFKPARYHACSLAILAMSHHKLGQQTEASNFRQQLDDLMEQAEFKDDQDSKSFLLEVNELFDAKPEAEKDPVPEKE